MDRLNTANRGNETSGQRRFRMGSARGFTLLEMMIVVGITLVTAAFAILGLRPMFQQSRVTSAYNSTLATIRRGHDEAAAERRVFVVTFDNSVTPNTVTISQNDTLAAGGTLLLKTSLPPDITFRTESGIPTTNTGTCPTPDGFGTGGKAIDFDQGVGGGGATSIYFYPDGSAHDKPLNGYINSGVVYLARQGELYSSRAITVWGTTGRIRGWRLYAGSTSGTNCWRPQ
jgi:prepilin-type N-terminal cleavage/methylation domain-containing protein